MTWVVTGAASGIGAQLVRDLVDAGERVRVWDRVAPAVDGAEHDVVDLLDADQIEEAASRLGGPVRAFVHCAGVALLTNSVDGNVGTALRSCFDLHVVAFAVSVRALLPKLTPDGAVVAITSAAQDMAYPGTMAYGASKAALERVVRQMSVELAPRGIRVNAVCPGSVATPMTVASWANPAEAEARKQFIPLGRQASTGDISAAVRFLASDEAGFITGETLRVDGGTRYGMYNVAIRNQMKTSAADGAIAVAAETTNSAVR
jgi:NAD(P)-dependent dehydrogenase (short-subunit alcohol dehydrogenase family)